MKQIVKKLVEPDHGENPNELFDLRGLRLPPVQEKNMASLKSRKTTANPRNVCISPHDKKLHELLMKFPYYGLVPVNILDASFFMLSNNDDLIAKIFFHYGSNSYETFSVTLFGHLAKESAVILDIGSYTGLFGLLSTQVNPSAKVIAFEPITNTATRVEENRDLNGIMNLEVVNKAVSNEDGVADFTLYGTNTGTTGASLESKPGKPSIGNLEVETIALDTYCEQQKLRPNLLKIDVEKGELKVLKGATNMLREHRPNIMLEVIVQDELNAIVDYLSNYDYHFGMIDDYGLDVKFFDSDSYDRVGEHKLVTYCNVFCFPAEKKKIASQAVQEVKTLLDS